MTSCVAGTRSPSAVENSSSACGKSAVSLPSTSPGFKGLGTVRISVSAMRNTPANGSCAACASAVGVNAVFGTSPPTYAALRSSVRGIGPRQGYTARTAKQSEPDGHPPGGPLAARHASRGQDQALGRMASAFFNSASAMRMLA